MIYQSLVHPVVQTGIRNGLGSLKADFRAMHTIFKEHLKKNPGEGLSGIRIRMGHKYMKISDISQVFLVSENIFFLFRIPLPNTPKSVEKHSFSGINPLNAPQPPARSACRLRGAVSSSRARRGDTLRTPERCVRSRPRR